MSGRVLLDTNIIIAHFKNASHYGKKLLELDYFIPQTVVGELYAGAFHSARPEHHASKIKEFLQYGSVLDADSKTSVIYGKIWSQLSKKGKPIPTNDIWIAALSAQHNMILASNDQHFGHIDGLQWQIW